MIVDVGKKAPVLLKASQGLATSLASEEGALRLLAVELGALFDVRLQLGSHLQGVLDRERALDDNAATQSEEGIDVGEGSGGVDSAVGERDLGGWHGRKSLRRLVLSMESGEERQSATALR